MTPEDKLRLDELGKFGISIADREWILALINRQDAEIQQLKTELITAKESQRIEESSAVLPKIRGQGGKVA
jgi:hypothetical protein